MTNKTLLLASTCVLGVACAPTEAPIVDSVDLSLEIDNGVSINGTSFDATPIETVDQQFIDSNLPSWERFPLWTPDLRIDRGVNPYAGVGANGNAISGVRRSDLRGVRLASGSTVDRLIGAQIEAETIQGNKTLLNISGAAVGQGDNRDLLYFVVHAADGAGWSPLCGTNHKGQPIPALAVPGTWNHSAGNGNGGRWHGDGQTFSFACRGSSVAKCMEAGYKPWTDPNSGRGQIRRRSKSAINRPNHLQACVRMLRADYCGDGTSHTVNGRTIEFWDSMGMHNRTAPHFTFEAAWTADGVTAMDYPRVMNYNRGMPYCFYEVPWGSSAMMNPNHSDLDNLRRQGHMLFSSYEDQLVIGRNRRRRGWGY